MFRTSRNDKVNISVSDANVMTPTKSEDDGWEVVKSTTTSVQAKVSTGSASIADVSTQTEQTGCEVRKDGKGDDSKSIKESASLVKEVNNPVNSSSTSSGQKTVDVIPMVSLQDLLESIDLSQVAEQGTKSYYLVKRNLKTVALLFLLGVFCVNKFPAAGQQRSKREAIRSSLPEASMSDGNEKAEYALLVEQLREQIEQIEESKRQLSHDLAMAIFDRNHWRTMAVSCDHDLRELSSSHARLEDELKQSKWLAPVAFVSPAPPPRMNFTAIAATAFNEEHQYEEDLLLRAPEPSPAKRIPFPQLALPEREPMGLLPKPSMKMRSRGKPYSALILAPSVAMTAV